jgi:antitoxin VapB
MPEFDEKQKHIRTMLAERGLDAVVLKRVSSFAWATCGASSYINVAATEGVATLLITPTARHVITSNNEVARFEQEEKLVEQGWEMHVVPWHGANHAISDLTRGLKLGADGEYPGCVNLSNEIACLRANLAPEEGERFRTLGRLCADAMNSAIRAVRPGQTEYEIATLLVHH